MTQVTEQSVIEDLLVFQDSEGHENGGKAHGKIQKDRFITEQWMLPNRPDYAQPPLASAQPAKRESGSERLCAHSYTLSHG